MVNLPSVLETVVRSRPVSWLMAVIVTPGSIAFCASTTVPLISERPPCAAAAAAKASGSISPARIEGQRRIIKNLQIDKDKSLPPERELLRAPVPHFSDPQVRFGPAVNRVDHPELLRQLAGFTESADDPPAQLHFVDLAGVHALGIVRVRAVEKLRRASRDADRLRHADVGDLRLERAFTIKHLDALVPRVGHVDVSGRVAGDAANAVELSLRRAGLAPGLEEIAVPVELRNAVVRSESVGDINVAGAVPRHIRRPVETVAVDARARGSAGVAAATATTAAAARGRRAALGEKRRISGSRRNAGAGTQ